MSVTSLGIIGGGQLGSMLATAASKLNIKSVIFSDEPDAPAQNFCDLFLYGKYNDDVKINEFISNVDVVTFEFENIPFNTSAKINEFKKVFPHPKINKIIQNRLSEKDFLNKCNIRTTAYTSIQNEKDLRSCSDLVPGILKTNKLGIAL